MEQFRLLCRWAEWKLKKWLPSGVLNQDTVIIIIKMKRTLGGANNWNILGNTPDSWLYEDRQCKKKKGNMMLIWVPVCERESDLGKCRALGFGNRPTNSWHLCSVKIIIIIIMVKEIIIMTINQTMTSKVQGCLRYQVRFLSAGKWGFLWVSEWGGDPCQGDPYLSCFCHFLRNYDL